MRSGLAVAALGISLLGAALAGCGSQDGSLVGYSPEGQPSNAVLLTDVVPDTRLTVVFTDTLTNAGDSLDTFEITGGAGVFPVGTAFGLFKGDGVTPLPDTDGNHLLDTGPIAAGTQVLIQLHATLPANSAGGPYQANLTAGSVRDPSKSATAANVLGEIFPAARTLPTDSAPAGPIGDALAQGGDGFDSTAPGAIRLNSGIAPKRVDATSDITFHGETITRAWPTFSDKVLVTGLIVDNTVADGFRIYGNPADQGFRPAEDFIAHATANWSTGWSFFSIRLATFDPAAGTDFVGRGAVGGLESGAAPVTEHSYLPISTPAQLTHRENVLLIAPVDSATTDSIPVLSWSPTAGASRYLVQIFGRNGLQYLALTDQTSHQVEGSTGLIFQDQPLRDGQFFRWNVFAVDSRNRFMGYSRELRALLIKTGH